VNLLYIEVKKVPVKVYNSVGKVEVYHILLQQAFKIIQAELSIDYTNKICLQLAVKAVNNIAGPDGIVPTLLVFGAYPCITNEDLLLLLTVKRVQAVQNATKEL
jgi:hypothetical protein